MRMHCSSKIINVNVHLFIRTLDYLICNAGVFGAPFKLTEDNYERTFQVNVLSHFYLILLCKPLLISTKGSRIIILSSESHRYENHILPLTRITFSLTCPLISYSLAQIVFDDT